MMGSFEDYLNLVSHVEGPDTLAPYAKSSFEAFDSADTFIGGEEIRSYFQQQIEKSSGRLEPRTPLQRERDRIVHSVPLRNLAEKFHVLYFRDQRITRNYITHAMRMAQITRAICRGLRLNQDFAEALALGTRVGTTPFKHVANETVATWVESTVAEIAGAKQKGLALPPNSVDLPPWITDCPSGEQKKIRVAIPAARMKNAIDRGYSAGKQSYLVLMTNPYLFDRTQSRWYRETAYAIWRHSLNFDGTPESEFSFSYEWPLGETRHEFSWVNETYEAMVVRLADDVTWVIENLQDANYARLLSSGGSQELFADIHAEYAEKLDRDVLAALAHKDPSQLYNFFIIDCINTTERRLRKIEASHKDWFQQRQALRAGEKEASVVCLSEEGRKALVSLRNVLFERVFGDPRTENRNKVLSTILEFVAGQLFGSWQGPLPSGTGDWVRQRAKRYPAFRPEEVIGRADKDPYFRVQLVVNVMSELTDSDVFQMVGMGTI